MTYAAAIRSDAKRASTRDCARSPSEGVSVPSAAGDGVGPRRRQEDAVALVAELPERALVRDDDRSSGLHSLEDHQRQIDLACEVGRGEAEYVDACQEG